MKVLKLTASGEARLIGIENDLGALQREVGGHIETVTLAPGCVMIVDKERLLKGKPENAKASEVSCMHIVGDALLCGVEEDEFADLPSHIIGLLEGMFGITGEPEGRTS